MCELTVGDIYEDGVAWERGRRGVYALIDQVRQYEQIGKQRDIAGVMLKLIEALEDPEHVPVLHRERHELEGQWGRYVEDADLRELTDKPVFPLLDLDSPPSTRFPVIEEALNRMINVLVRLGSFPAAGRDAARLGALMAGHAGAALKGGSAEQFFRLSQEAAVQGGLNEVVAEQLATTALPLARSMGPRVLGPLPWDRIRDDVVTGFFEASDQEPVELQPCSMTDETIERLIGSLENVRDGKTEPLDDEHGLVRIRKAAEEVGLHDKTLRERTRSHLRSYTNPT